MNTLTEKERQAIDELSIECGIEEANGVWKGAEFLAELRKEQAPNEKLSTQITEFLWKHNVQANAVYFGKEIAKLLTTDVNAELLEALNDLYQSLPDGYTDECLVKVKKQLLPYWNERSKLLSQQLEDEEF